MSNSHVVITACSRIKCPESTWDDLQELLLASALTLEDGKEGHGFTFSWVEDELYACAKIFGDPDELPLPVRMQLGLIIAVAAVPYWEFGYARFEDDADEDSAGGGGFRIFPNGSIVWADLVFPEKEEHFMNEEAHLERL